MRNRPMPMRRFPVLLIALAASAVAAGPLIGDVSPAVPNATNVLTTISVADLTDLLKSEGYTAEPSPAGTDIVWKIDGTRARVFVAADGSSIQFYAGLKKKGVTLDAVNNWNKSRKYSRSYLDDDGDPCLEVDLDLAGGVARDRVVDWAKTSKVSFEGWTATVLQ